MGKGTGGAEAEARFVLKEYLHMNKGVFLKLYVTDLQNNISVIFFFFISGVWLRVAGKVVGSLMLRVFS